MVYQSTHPWVGARSLLPSKHSRRSQEIGAGGVRDEHCKWFSQGGGARSHAQIGHVQGGASTRARYLNGVLIVKCALKLAKTDSASLRLFLNTITCYITWVQSDPDAEHAYL